MKHKEVIAMVKFAKTRVRPHSKIKTVGHKTSRTYEGARAYTRDPKSELFLLARSVTSASST